MEYSESNLNEEKFKTNKKMKKHLHFKTLFLSMIFVIALSSNLKAQCSVTFTAGPSAPLTWTVIPTYGANTAGAYWIWGDGNTSTALYPSHTYTASGWYNICVSVWDAAFTCSTMTCDSSFVVKGNMTQAPIQINVITGPTGIHETSVSKSLGLSPNPSTGKVTLPAQKENGLVNIYNMLGMKVQEIKIEANTSTDMNLSGFDNGIYFVEFNNGKTKVREKVILTK